PPVAVIDRQKFVMDAVHEDAVRVRQTGVLAANDAQRPLQLFGALPIDQDGVKLFHSKSDLTSFTAETDTPNLMRSRQDGGIGHVAVVIVGKRPNLGAVILSDVDAPLGRVDLNSSHEAHSSLVARDVLQRLGYLATLTVGIVVIYEVAAAIQIA